MECICFPGRESDLSSIQIPVAPQPSLSSARRVVPRRRFRCRCLRRSFRSTAFDRDGIATTSPRDDDSRGRVRLRLERGERDIRAIVALSVRPRPQIDGRSRRWGSHLSSRWGRRCRRRHGGRCRRRWKGKGE